MVKKLAIVTYYTDIALQYSRQLKYLFNNYVNIETYSFESVNINEIDADVILAATYNIYSIIKKNVKNRETILIANITLTKEGLEKITAIPKGTTAMLVNSNAEMAIETISIIYQLGITHVDLIPVYPGMDDIPKLNLAITPDEVDLVPEGVTNVINIGHRVLDLSTIVDIAVKLELSFLLRESNIRNFFKSNVTNNFGIKDLLIKTDRLENQLELLLNVMDQGIIGIDKRSCIYIYNNAAENITGLKKEEVLGENANTIFPNLCFNQVLKTSKPVEGKLVKINYQDIAANIYPLLNVDMTQGAIAIIKRFMDAEKLQHKFRAQTIRKGYTAKYTFDDIIGQSDAALNIKEIAKNMSKSDSTVLIYGESGTGKELYAQAIHNFSKRKDYPFIAVNCAAIPESLLESELFGYEEGAFTGAKKGGKLGVFELAHMGTLFLDEIGEMELQLQSRLLRILQEKEVVRIGGDYVINIDVRVIAATNRNLKELVSRGKFRSDLYYRLNVLPLNLPPLSERKKDIPLLIDYFKKKSNSDFELSPEVCKAMQEYNWKGNIRELQNCIEYLFQTGKKVIELRDLPFIFNTVSDSINLDESEKEILDNFKIICRNKFDKYMFVLEVLKHSNTQSIHIGRRGIAATATQNSIYLSETEIRSILISLSNYGLAEISTGRVGTCITDLGLRAIEYYKDEKASY